LTLTTAAVWISMAVGSIGIAGLGGAIGIPLAVILIPLGLLSGGFLDEDGLLSRTRKRSFELFGIRNVEDRKEVDAELALTVQGLKQIADRVDEISEFAHQLTYRVEEIERNVEVVTRRQLWQYRFTGLLGVILLIALALIIKR
jgi:hypothetical protein